MSDEPISTPRRQRILLGLPYGLSNATLLAGLSAAGVDTSTAPKLPPAPEKPEAIERPTSAHPGILWVRRKDKTPSTIRFCTCGRRISANKDQCARCSG